MTHRWYSKQNEIVTAMELITKPRSLSPCRIFIFNIRHQRKAIISTVCVILVCIFYTGSFSDYVKPRPVELKPENEEVINGVSRREINDATRKDGNDVKFVTIRRGISDTVSDNSYRFENEEYVTESSTVKKTLINSDDVRVITVNSSQSGTNTSASHSVSPSSPVKTVLFYSKYFGDNWDGFLGSNSRKMLTSCPVHSCIFLQNSSHPEDADAVVFHLGDFTSKNVPKIRRQKQRYIWLTQEAPLVVSTSSITISPLQRIAQKNMFGEAGFFNWTATYNRHSDIYLPYGGLEPLEGGSRVDSRGIVLDRSEGTYQRYMAALDRGDQPTLNTNFTRRHKMAAWMVSHCSTASGREFYVRELRRYVDVDVYGWCGELKCGSASAHLDTYCYTHLLARTYKFYLAFENNLCVDYLTEKVWMPLRYGLVPVVYGGADYSAFLPPDSYIDATHLTPQELATLLISVGSSEREYSRYHLWREYWRVTTSFPLCELCRKLHQPGTSSHLHLASWWRTVNNCTTSFPFDRFPRPPEPDTRPTLQKLRDATKFLAGMAANFLMS